MTKNRTKTYELIMFDLDGTLTDSREGITRSIKAALEKAGCEIPDERTLNRFIGPPLHSAFQEILGFDAQMSARVVSCFRERYQKKGIYENNVYPGTREVLDKLSGSYELAVATAKPEASARIVLEYFGLAHYFSHISGATLDGDKIHKDQIIEDVLKHFNHIPCSRILMVGDRVHDIEGAKKNGIDVVAVSYGYGTDEELSGADACIDRIEQLPAYLEKQGKDNYEK